MRDGIRRGHHTGKQSQGGPECHFLPPRGQGGSPPSCLAVPTGDQPLCDALIRATGRQRWVQRQNTGCESCLHHLLNGGRHCTHLPKRWLPGAASTRCAEAYAAPRAPGMQQVLGTD